MMQRILVEVNYMDFYFDNMEEAVAFAETAVKSASEDVRVSLTVKFLPEEVTSESGED